MKTRPLFGLPGLIGLILALNFQPCLLGAEEKPRPPASPARTAGSRYEIEVVNGQLLLANLKDRIDVNAKWGNATKVDSSLRNLVEVLRDLHTNANIAMAPGAERIEISNLKLRSTQLENELEAIRVASGNRFNWKMSGTPGSEIPLFLLTPNLDLPEGNRSPEVFNLSGYFQQFGETDKSDKEKALELVKEIILNTLEGLRLGGPDERPDFQFHPGANLLIVIGRPEALDVARKVIGALPNQGSAGANDLAFFRPGSFGQGGFGQGGFSSDPNNPFGGTSKSRRQILGKLESIRLESVHFDDLPLKELVNVLAEESKRRDPEKKGINFLVQGNQPEAATPATSIDPATGRPIPTDLNAIKITINPPLNNMRLLDVLDAVVKVAGHPMKYSITDYGVVFSLREPNEPVRQGTPGARYRGADPR